MSPRAIEEGNDNLADRLGGAGASGIEEDVGLA